MLMQIDLQMIVLLLLCTVLSSSFKKMPGVIPRKIREVVTSRVECLEAFGRTVKSVIAVIKSPMLLLKIGVQDPVVEEVVFL